MTIQIFDGHNDLVLRLMNKDITAQDVVQGISSGHIDLPRAQKGGLAGGFFAIFVPNREKMNLDFNQMKQDAYHLPLPTPLEQSYAKMRTDEGFAALGALADAGAITICRTINDLGKAIQGQNMGAIIHIEGAEAIDPEFEVLHEYYAKGLRSLGPVWSRPTKWGHGVPFAYPAEPDIGPGLTGAGKELIRECNALGIMIDLSHLNQKGFDDVAQNSDAPLVATHSNAWAISPHARNLTDDQLAIIRQSGGMVGVNYACAFLRPDGKMNDDFSLDIVVRHFDHLIAHLGEESVGFGSDFDGALVPKPLGDCAGLPKLVAALRRHGYDDALLKKISYENWLRVLKRTWKA